MMARLSLPVLVVVLSLSYVACKCPIPEPPADAACSSGPPLRVKRLPGAPVQEAGQASDALRVPRFLVAELGTDRQWARVRGRCPARMGEGDFHMRVHMAHDGRYWYVAADIEDDRVLPAADSEYPYSGDCFELFLAADQLEYSEDFRRLVETGPPFQRAFLQIQVPPPALRLPAEAHLSDWRTDPALKLALRSEGFEVALTGVRSHWRSFIRIPLRAIGGKVQEALGDGAPLKAAFDYLDYDSRVASRTPKDGWGFRPDNVFAMDRQEVNVNVPACMRAIVFEK